MAIGERVDVTVIDGGVSEENREVTTYRAAAPLEPVHTTTHAGVDFHVRFLANIHAIASANPSRSAFRTDPTIGPSAVRSVLSESSCQMSGCGSIPASRMLFAMAVAARRHSRRDSLRRTLDDPPAPVAYWT